MEGEEGKGEMTGERENRKEYTMRKNSHSGIVMKRFKMKVWRLLRAMNRGKEGEYRRARERQEKMKRVKTSWYREGAFKGDSLTVDEGKGRWRWEKRRRAKNIYIFKVSKENKDEEESKKT